MLQSEIIRVALAELAENRQKLDKQESELKHLLRKAELQEARLLFRESEELIRRQGYQLADLWPNVSVNRQFNWTTAVRFDRPLYEALLKQRRDWGPTLWFVQHLAEKLWPVLEAIPLQTFYPESPNVSIFYPVGYDLLTGYFHEIQDSEVDKSFNPLCRTVYLIVDDVPIRHFFNSDIPVDPNNFTRCLRIIGGNHVYREGNFGRRERRVEWELELRAQVTNSRQSNIFEFDLPSVDSVVAHPLVD